MANQKVLTFLVLVMLPATSHAYLDPGTGSMILQGLIAGIAIAAVTIKQYWYRILAFFSRDSEPEAESTEQNKSNDG